MTVSVSHAIEKRERVPMSATLSYLLALRTCELKRPSVGQQVSKASSRVRSVAPLA
jgi:hypothetical protein